MSLVRSGQKNLDEIQRIRAALEGSKPVVTGAQRELIGKYAALLGKDGEAMIQDIEEKAMKPGKLPADVFRLIDSCLHSLGQRAKRQDLSNEVIKQREPERLMQVEAIREYTTKLAGALANGDNAAVESIRQATLMLVSKFMEAVDKDKDDGLDPDTARAWKDQVHEIAVQAKLDQPPEGSGGSGEGPTAPTGAANCLAPLKSAIKLATNTIEVVAKEMRDPDETTLRGYGKQLGNSKKEIMALSRSLMLDQSAGVAMEATRLASEACDAVKASRESIRTALRGMGAASDISEVSGPTGTWGPPPMRPVVGNIDPEWATGTRSAALGWAQRPSATKPAVGNIDPDWTTEAQPAASGWPPVHMPATTAWPPMESLPRPRIRGTGGELSVLMRGMMNAQANDSR
jgi:hypothetical protein